MNSESGAAIQGEASRRGDTKPGGNGQSIVDGNFPQEAILIVDDEQDVLKALRRELSYWSAENRVRVLLASSSERALELLSQEADGVALVISDLRMPGMKGSDLLVRVHELYPEISLSLLTAYSDVQEIQKAISATLHSLILKPWDTDALILQIEKALSTYRLKIDNRRYLSEIGEQLEAAGHFQRGLMRVVMPHSELLQIDVSYRPSPKLHVGGDYYDLINLGEEKYLVLLADVSGHGIKPALVTAMLKIYATELSTDTELRRSPAMFLEQLNRRVYQDLENAPDLIIPVTAVFVDAAERRLVVSNAGHLPVALIREGGCTFVHLSGTAMGMTDDLIYDEQELGLKRGDRVVIYTDGLYAAGPFGPGLDEPQLEQLLLEANREEDLNAAVLRLWEERTKSPARAPWYRSEDSDDVTLVSIRIT